MRSVNWITLQFELREKTETLKRSSFPWVIATVNDHHFKCGTFGKANQGRAGCCCFEKRFHTFPGFTQRKTTNSFAHAHNYTLAQARHTREARRPLQQFVIPIGAFDLNEFRIFSSRSLHRMWYEYRVHIIWCAFIFVRRARFMYGFIARR